MNISINHIKSAIVLNALEAFKEQNSLSNINFIFTQEISDLNFIIINNINKAKEYNLDFPSDFKKGGYQIIQKDDKNKKMVFIICNEECGAAYGILELSEQYSNYKNFNVFSAINNPMCEFRAIKINLPWSSYREGECLNIHKKDLKDKTFWKKFINMMFINRFNALTIWSLHPFQFMIKSKKYPLATSYSDSELEEWRCLWKYIFKTAKEHGIETYIINWNIFVSEEFKKNYDNNAVSDLDGHFAPYTYHSDIVDDYLYESVVQLINEYDDLTGFGTSLGERMVGMENDEKQKWIENVYFRALKDAKRTVKFIHRAAFSVSGDLTRNSIENSNLNNEILVEIKFNWSHSYSSTNLTVTHGGKKGISKYWDPEPKNYKIVWMMRNEDFYTLRWAQADFIRSHIMKNKKSFVAGYFIGSECFIPACDYSHKRPSDHITWQYAFEKNYLYYMLWGRLLFNPQLSDEVFIKAIAKYYNYQDSQNLFYAYSHACKMPIALAEFHNADNDWSLYSEGFLASAYKLGYGDGKAFISVMDLCKCSPMDSNVLSVEKYVNMILSKEQIPFSFTTPLMISEQLMQDAIQSEKYLSLISTNGGPLECETLDIKAWIYLSKYFSVKLKAAIFLELYNNTNNILYKNQCHELLVNALSYWNNLVQCTDCHYKEQPLMQLIDTKFSWKMITPQVEKEANNY